MKAERPTTNINLFRLFAKVAETGNIAAAARQFDVSPSVASRQMYQLERVFNTKLLLRNTRRLSLTPAGNALLDYARTTTRGFDELMEELDELQQKPLGLITLACTRFIATTYLPTIIQEFSTKYPAIQFDVKTSNEPIKLLDQCDLAVVSGRIPTLGLIARRVGEYQRILCASKDYVAKYSTPVGLSDLQDHHCLCHSVQELSRWAFMQDNEIVIQDVRPHVATDCFLMLAEMLYAGLGIARIARPLVADKLKSGELVELLPSYRCVYPDGGIPGTWMVFSDRRMLSRTRLFSDFVARELRKASMAGAI